MRARARALRINARACARTQNKNMSIWVVGFTVKYRARDNSLSKQDSLLGLPMTALVEVASTKDGFDYLYHEIKTLPQAALDLLRIDNVYHVKTEHAGTFAGKHYISAQSKHLWLHYDPPNNRWLVDPE
jgi:hypothetical protein